jgi:hypothetical protein
MGAALTYARRYSLFSLVGIAGEDDLDAPDLNVRPGPTGGANGKADTAPQGSDAGNFSSSLPARSRPVRKMPEGRRATAALVAAAPLWDQLSAVLRNQLLGEVIKLRDDDEAARWALRALPAKNRLTDADARRVEEAFQTQLAGFVDADDPSKKLDPTAGHAADSQHAGSPSPSPDAVTASPEASTEASKAGRRRRSSKRQPALEPDPSRLTLDGTLPFAVTDGEEAVAQEAPAPRIDKADLALSEPRRHRDRDHLKFITLQPCLLCGRRPTDAHHLRFAQSAALGRRVSDEFTVPLCRLHHRALHRRGDEAAWWAEQQVEPLQVAQKLWSQTHGNGARLGFPPTAIGPAR